MNTNKINICVLGAGISGFTTALALELFGFRTRIVAREFPEGIGNPLNPWASTDFAMATAYPHAVAVEDQREIHQTSQAAWQSLHAAGAAGISVYRLFEIFEQQQDNLPALADMRTDFRSFSGDAEELERDLLLPVRPGARHLWGWSFHSYFIDMPPYLSLLRRWYAVLGGRIERNDVNSEFIAAAPEEIFVNALGFGARDLLDDSTEYRILRGRQVLVPGMKKFVASDGTAQSYNYTPASEFYPRADGDAEYLHFFPREDGWLLGQTREPGSCIDGEWHGDAVNTEEIILNGVSVPRPIVELNKDILRNWTGAAFPESGLIGRVGYRYYRDPAKSGVRIEQENQFGKQIFHNYGHAGSGITISWGCSMRVVSQIQNSLSSHARQPEDSQRTLSEKLSAAAGYL